MGVNDDPLLEPAEVARLLKVSERHVRQLAEKHGLPKVKLGRIVRYRRSDIDQYIEQHCVSPR